MINAAMDTMRANITVPFSWVGAFVELNGDLSLAVYSLVVNHHPRVAAAA
jgi:hypothetical protein